MKTSELTAHELDWAVAKAEGEVTNISLFIAAYFDSDMYQYSTDWAHGGPIIERESISAYPDPAADQPEIAWSADSPDAFRWSGPTLLIAAMRCYVASKLGDEVDIPEELT